MSEIKNEITEEFLQLSTRSSLKVLTASVKMENVSEHVPRNMSKSFPKRTEAVLIFISAVRQKARRSISRPA